jgi:hypothetical protein
MMFPVSAVVAKLLVHLPSVLKMVSVWRLITLEQCVVARKVTSRRTTNIIGEQHHAGSQPDQKRLSFK